MQLFLILSLLANCVLGALAVHFYQQRNKWRKWAFAYSDALRAQTKGMIAGAVLGIGFAVLRRFFGNDGESGNAS